MGATIDTLQNLSDSLAGEAGLVFNINTDSVAEFAQKTLMADGFNMSIREIKENRALMNGYKIKMLHLKSTMASAMINIKELSTSMVINITAVGTAAGASSVPNPALGAASMKSLADNFKSALNNIMGQCTNILGIAATGGIELPTSFLSSISTITILKNSLSSF